MGSDNKDAQGGMVSKPALYVRCKVCGFVMHVRELRECCPACGVKLNAFVPDTERISEKRRKILGAHIHPIIVHLPQAFAFSAIVLSVSLFFIPKFLITHVWHALQVLAFVLPFTGVIGMLSGLYDGKVRFKKVTTPLLKQKIAWGFCFIVASTGVTWQTLTSPTFVLSPGIATLIVCSAATFVCTVFLGKIGALLACSRMPG